ncbi:MAG: hypothetical protein ACYC1Q_13345 [Bacteroidia bacterium]
MKKSSYLPLLAFVLVAGLGSCQKEQRVDCFEQNPEQRDLNLSAETPEGFADQIPAAFDKMEVFGGTETEAFYMENEGIPSFLDEEPFCVEELNGKNPVRCHPDSALQLNREQKTHLLAAWKDYLHCRQTAMEKMRRAHRELHARMENKRSDLIKAFRDGRLTERAFKAAMEKLRHEFKMQNQKLIRVHLDVIQHCYKAYLTKVQRILSPEQFRAFMRCHKMNLPDRR